MDKKIKNKRFILLFFFIVFILSVARFASALEVNLPGLSGNEDIGQYVAYIYQIGIGLAGGLALLSFVIGAIGFMVSGDNPTVHGDSIDRMKGAILGLIILTGSFLVIKTINPHLLDLSIAPLTPVTLPDTPPVPGVYFYATGGCSGTASGPFRGPQRGLGGNIGSIKIINDEEDDLTFGAILHRSNLASGGECTEPIVTAGCHSVNIKAFTADIFNINQQSGDGITFYSTPHGWDAGENPGSYKVSDTTIRDPFYKISNLDTMCFDYTGINRPGAYKYKCENNKCGNIGYGGGAECTTDSDCDVENGERCNTSMSLCVSSDCSQNACETFQDCPGSVRIGGDYLVAFYSTAKNNNTSVLYCQTFSSLNVENLDARPFRPSGVKKIDSIYIIPIGAGTYGGGGPTQ